MSGQSQVKVRGKGKYSTATPIYPTRVEKRDTIVALATPLGVSGLAVIRLSGPKTLAVLDRIVPEVKFQNQPSHTLRLVWINDERKRPIDQVMVAVFRSPRSYTGEDMAEITCHGGLVIIDRIIELCRKFGCRLAEPGEFTRRAVLAGKLTLSQAEAILGMVNARTMEAHQCAVSAYQGATTRFISEIGNRLRDLYAEAEFLLGFDEAEGDRNGLTRGIRGLLTRLNRTIERAKRIRFLFEPARVVIVGRANVGKSSLFNRLLQEERVIVSPVPGTTRDRVEVTFNIDGITVSLTDTCGFDPKAKDSLTRLGSEQTQRAIADADLLLVVFDGSEPLKKEDEAVFAQTKEKPKIYIINKSDLPRRLKRLEALGAMGVKLTPIVVSCKTGSNINQVRRALKEFLAPRGAPPPTITRRQIEILQECRDALQASLIAPDLETQAVEIKEGLAALAKIDGGVTSEEILNRIFHQFCIGK